MLCVIAKIDKCAVEKLKAIQRAAVSESAARPIYGHITIAAYMGDDEVKFIAEEYGESLNQWTRTDEMWLPHTTLLHDPDMDMIDMRDICRKMESRFEPFTAVVESIEFSMVTEVGYKIVGGVELRG